MGAWHQIWLVLLAGNLVALLACAAWLRTDRRRLEAEAVEIRAAAQELRLVAVAQEVEMRLLREQLASARLAIGQGRDREAPQPQDLTDEQPHATD